MSTFSPEILDLASEVVRLCAKKGLMVTTAESCTGGLVAGALTEIPGSSACLMGGFVTYSDFMKSRVLGVSVDTLGDFGAVSEETAREMASGALKAATADISIAITGIAGPDGGSPEKPVGTVHFSTAKRGEKGIETHHERHYIQNRERNAIRREAVEIALTLLKQQAASF